MALENPFFIDLGKIAPRPRPKKGFKISIRFIVKLILLLVASAFFFLIHISANASA